MCFKLTYFELRQTLSFSSNSSNLVFTLLNQYLFLRYWWSLPRLILFLFFFSKRGDQVKIACSIAFRTILSMLQSGQIVFFQKSVRSGKMLLCNKFYLLTTLVSQQQLLRMKLFVFDAAAVVLPFRLKIIPYKLHRCVQEDKNTGKT